MFEARKDIRFFESRVAHAVRARKVEVHSFCILPNHFHLLLRSLTGELSGVLQWIQHQYARRFNWGRERVGHLFQGRFRSKAVVDAAHWENIVRYIDQNPVAAGLVERAEHYPYGSARHYAGHGGPPWLTRHIAEAVVRAASPPSRGQSDGYLDVFSARNPEFIARFVESRLHASEEEEDRLSHLVLSAPREVRSWMEATARDADRIPAGVVFADPATVLGITRDLEALRTRTGTRGPRTPLRVVFEAGLLRTLCGVSIEELALRLRCSYSTAQRRLSRFGELLSYEPEMVELAAEIFREAVSKDLPGIIAPRELLETLPLPPTANPGSLCQAPGRSKSSVQT
jgi:REP element-mobilizing transposase RayT